jgi:hypothetical protein
VRVEAKNAHGAGGGSQEVEQTFDRGRFTRAVSAKKP